LALNVPPNASQKLTDDCLINFQARQYARKSE
jgi:hypothetical protein